MQRLLEVSSGNDVPCEILRMTVDEIVRARTAWAGAFQARHVNGIHDDDALLWTHGMMSNLSPPGDGGLHGYVVTAGNEIQGVLVIDRQPRASRADPSAVLTYVHYLATAPWNRPSEQSAGQFRGVGRLLVVQAALEGRTLGSRGAIGLHSFPGATPFYDLLGFTNFGVDPAKRGMFYLELPADVSHRLVAVTKR